MLQAVIRRLFLLLSVICGIGFALIFLHSLIEPTAFSKLYAGIGTGAACAAILISWIALVKTDDYLIPSHTKAFFLIAIGITSLLGFGLLAFFYFGKSYPGSFLRFFGIAPAIFAIIFAVIGFIRIKEAYSLPPEYRPTANGDLWAGFLPPALSAIAAIGACFLFVQTIGEITYTSAVKINPAATTPKPAVATEDQSAKAEELLTSARKLQAENRYRSSHDEFIQAANLGSIEAHYELALIYSGDGYFRAPEKAVEHFTIAAEKGHMESLYRLGKAFRHGEFGLSADSLQAKTYLEQAAIDGHVEAQKQLANIFNNGGNGVPADPAQAIHWFRQAAEQGDPTAQNDLAILLINGADPDPEEGLRWLESAAEQGVTVAEYNLARAYYTGSLTKKDHARAFQYFSKLAQKGLPHGFQMTGIQLLNGEGVEKDEAAAFQAFQAGTQRGHAESRFYLGYCYLHGIGAKRDTTAALRHIEAAALQQVSPAQLLLAKIHLEGNLLVGDKVEAAKWLTLAAAHGEQEAAGLLQSLTPTLTPEERNRASRLAAALQEKQSVKSPR